MARGKKESKTKTKKESSSQSSSTFSQNIGLYAGILAVLIALLSTAYPLYQNFIIQKGSQTTGTLYLFYSLIVPTFSMILLQVKAGGQLKKSFNELRMHLVKIESLLRDVLH